MATAQRVHTNQQRLRAAGILLLYLLLAVVYARPLLEQSGSRVVGDAGDPILNTSVLWWNATTIPFTARWWNPPYFYPSHDVSAFTENLVGISPFASPIYWLTGNPLTAYNLALFLTWPLSAFAMYLLILFLTKRQDAAFLAGLAYGFSPYRTAELGHLQMIATYWVPLMFLGLHGYLTDRRRRWLVLFGGAWLLQSLANAYMMLFGAVLIGLWLLYFCSKRSNWPAGGAILAAWSVASVPLLPIMLKYRSVHAFYGMRRNLDDPFGYSYPVHAFAEVSNLVTFWHRVLPEGSDNLFPGLTAVLLVVIALVLAAWHGRSRAGQPSRHRLYVGLALVTAASLAAALVTLVIGQWRFEIAGILVRMTNVNRALGLAIVCGVPLLLAPATREALAERRPLAFYVAGTLAMAAFACGPILRVGNQVLLDPAPYRWLMYLPGFREPRVPSRFWMLGILCLAIAAGLAFAGLPLVRKRARMVVFSLVAAGILCDGWLREVPMAVAPEPWPQVEASDQQRPILELPIGPGWDAASTFRSLASGRPMANGVSGYDPADYDPLQAGINALDPEMLLALATFGSYDVVINRETDPKGDWARYVSSLPGVTAIATDGKRTAYRVPASLPPDMPLGASLPIANVEVFRHDPGVIHDGRVETEWGDDPQRPDQWMIADLGSVQVVAGLKHALGEYARDFPRQLAIELSIDGASWTRVWEGKTAGRAFRAAVLAPREAVMGFTFAPQPARFVRLRQLAKHRNMWRIAEITVCGPNP